MQELHHREDRRHGDAHPQIAAATEREDVPGRPRRSYALHREHPLQTIEGALVKLAVEGALERHAQGVVGRRIRRDAHPPPGLGGSDPKASERASAAATRDGASAWGSPRSRRKSPRCSGDARYTPSRTTSVRSDATHCPYEPSPRASPGTVGHGDVAR